MSRPVLVLAGVLLALAVAVPGAAAAAAEPETAAAALAEGDRAWADRAQGAEGGRAKPEPVEVAIDAYEAARRLAPRSLEAHWKLVRALYFLGDFAIEEREARKRVYERGRTVHQAGMALLAETAGGGDLDRLAPDELAARLADVPDAAPVYFWGVVIWGRWAEASSKIAAARQGVGGRLRDDSLRLLAIDPRYEDAGGHRLLGRLHAEAPRIPFVTGWIDRDLAVAELRTAVDLAPGEPHNVYYLADALLAHRPSESAEARRLLAELATRSPRPEKQVEDASILELARRRLASLGQR